MDVLLIIIDVVGELLFFELVDDFVGVRVVEWVVWVKNLCSSFIFWLLVFDNFNFGDCFFVFFFVFKIIFFFGIFCCSKGVRVIMNVMIEIIVILVWMLRMVEVSLFDGLLWWLIFEIFCVVICVCCLIFLVNLVCGGYGYEECFCFW